MGITKKIKIYPIYYKPTFLLKYGACYSPLWAGKNGAPDIEGFTGDDTGENISEKNKYFSELTGIYWIWKNRHSDIVGFCHYRRYFTVFPESLLHRIKKLLYYPAGLWKKRHGLIYTSDYLHWHSKILTSEQAFELLENYDVILPERRILRQTIREHYEKYHNSEDLILIKEILTEQFPDYLNSFESILSSNRLFANNMFVMPWKTFDGMMNWLFAVLFEFEKRSQMDTYKGYQERVTGFLSERLITLWILHNKLNYKELQLIYFKKLKNKQHA